MERKNKACWSCYYYSAYYTKGYWTFNKKRFGCCNYKRQDTDNQSVCENWKDNSQKEESRALSAQRALIQICDDLAVLKQILVEEHERYAKND